MSMKVVIKSLVMVFMCAVIMVGASLNVQANKQITLEKDTYYWAGNNRGQFLCGKGHVIILYDNDTLREAYVKYGAHFFVANGDYVLFKEGFIGLHPNGMVRFGALDGDYFLENDKGEKKRYNANPNKTIFFNEKGQVTGYY